MAKQPSQEEFDHIVQVVQKYPNGASLATIMTMLLPPKPRRTLQRWLAILVKRGLIQEKGHTRGRQYFPVTSDIDKKVLTDIGIPLSAEALSLQASVTQPIQARTPIGYNRAFLDAYLPNTTFYLSSGAREHLATIGNVHDGNRPAGTYARLIFSRLLIDLSWNSSRLEGNTYSLLETKRLLEFGESSQGKDIKEAQMILNHKAAIEFLIESAEDIAINQYTIFNLHALLSNNLLADPDSCGRLRTIPVGIAKSVYRPLEVPQLIQECFLQILHTAHAIQDPFEQAFFLMVHLPYLQPFEDVNKRVSRLAANIPLIRTNICPLSFVDVPEDVYVSSHLAVYELNKVDFLRDVFIWAYERSCHLYSATRATLGEPDLFRFRYRDTIREIIFHIVHEHMSLKDASMYIEQFSKEVIPSQEKAHFASVIDTELASLHEGNIARYRIGLADYIAWSHP